MVSIAPTIDNTYGSALIGCILSGVFFGLICAQMFHYFKTFPEDGKWLKATIALLWFLDTLHIVMVVWDVYYFTITHAVSPNFDDMSSWLSGAIILFSNVNLGVIRAVFVYRIWTLSDKNKWCLICLLCLLTACAGFGMSYGIQLFFNTFSESHRFSWLLYVALCTDVATDLFISCALFILFRHLYSQAKTAHNLMHTLMLYSINTGLLQSTLALAVLCSYAIGPRLTIYMSIFLVYPKASLSSLISILNARTELRQMVHNPALFKFRTLEATDSNMMDAGLLSPSAKSPRSVPSQRYRNV